jgi:hypothetical protein
MYKINKGIIYSFIDFILKRKIKRIIYLLLDVTSEDIK